MVSTLKEISKVAGTSVSTASLILNARQGHRFAPATREAVVKAANQLGYRPQRAAQSLVTGKTNNIALIVNSLANPFYGLYASLLQARLMDRGYTAIPFEISSDDPDSKASWLEWIDQRAVDAAIDLQGALGLGPVSAKTYTTFKEHRPLVLRDTNDSPRIKSYDRVIVDYEVGTRQLIEHLADTGRKHLGVVTVHGHVPGRRTLTGKPIPDADFTTSLRRLCDRAGLQCPATHFRGAHDERPESLDWCQTTAELLRDQPQIDALLAHNIDTLPAVLHGIEQAGRTVGQDLAVATFDDLPIARWLGPGITVVGEPAEQVAEALADLVIDKLANPAAKARCVTLPTRLAVRGSTDPARAGNDPTHDSVSPLMEDRATDAQVC